MSAEAGTALLMAAGGVELVSALALLCAPAALAFLRKRRPQQPELPLLRALSRFVAVFGVAGLLDALARLDLLRLAQPWPALATITLSLLAMALAYPAVRRLLGLPSRQILVDANHRLAAQLARAGETIALSEARYRLLIDTTSEGVCILDRTGRLTFANLRMTEMLGFSVEQLKAMTLLDLVPETDRPGIVDSLQHHRQGLSVRASRQLLNAHGVPVPVHLSSSPMIDKGEVAGILLVANDQSGQMAAHDELQSLAAQVEDRIARRTQAYRETAANLGAALEICRFQSRNYGMLQEMADMLQSCSSTPEATRVAGEFASRLFDADAGTIYTVEPETGAFVAQHSWGSASESADRMLVGDCWALRQNKLYPNSVNQFGLRCNHLRLSPTRCTCCLPMSAHGEAAGLINLRRSTPFVKSDIEASAEFEKVAQLYTASIAQFLSNLALRRSLEQQSLRDPLTNLFNRRYFDEQLAMEFERAHRSGTPLALQMIDIDHFKRINDRFGHDAGDRVLRSVAEQLAHNARAGDIVCRWGGEEFLILMPGSTTSAARRRADEIRLRINESVEIAGGSRVSVSIGVACYPEHASDPDSLLEASDRALYAAKGEGRNRVIIAAAPA